MIYVVKLREQRESDKAPLLIGDGTVVRKIICGVQKGLVHIGAFIRSFIWAGFVETLDGTLRLL